MLDSTIDFSQNISSHSSLFSMSGPESKRGSVSQKYLGQPKEVRSRLGSASSGGILQVSGNTLPSVSEAQEDSSWHKKQNPSVQKDSRTEDKSGKDKDDLIDFGDDESEDSFVSNRGREVNLRKDGSAGSVEGRIHQLPEEFDEDNNDMEDAYEDGDRVLSSQHRLNPQDDDFMEV